MLGCLRKETQEASGRILAWGNGKDDRFIWGKLGSNVDTRLRTPGLKVIRGNWRQISGFKALAGNESSRVLSSHSCREHSLGVMGFKEGGQVGSRGTLAQRAWPYCRWAWISISLRSWCSTPSFSIWDLKRTLSATMKRLFFSRAKYTFPNLPLPRGRPISKSSIVKVRLIGEWGEGSWA